MTEQADPQGQREPDEDAVAWAIEVTVRPSGAEPFDAIDDVYTSPAGAHSKAQRYTTEADPRVIPLYRRAPTQEEGEAGKWRHVACPSCGQDAVTRGIVWNVPLVPTPPSAEEGPRYVCPTCDHAHDRPFFPVSTQESRVSDPNHAPGCPLRTFVYEVGSGETHPGCQCPTTVASASGSVTVTMPPPFDLAPTEPTPPSAEVEELAQRLWRACDDMMVLDSDGEGPPTGEYCRCCHAYFRSHGGDEDHAEGCIVGIALSLLAATTQPGTLHE